MAITVKGASGNEYTFEGTYSDSASLQNRSGVYLIVCETIRGKIEPLDVGETHDVKDRIKRHDRSDCWRRHCGGKIKFGVLYTPNQQQPGRKVIEQDIRKNTQYSFPCGKI